MPLENISNLVIAKVPQILPKYLPNNAKILQNRKGNEILGFTEYQK